MLANLPLWLLCLYTLLPLSRSACYFPNGERETNGKFRPCIAVDGHASMCCIVNGDKSDKCQSNGLCRDWANNYWRDSCTDRNWKDGNCLKNVCEDGSTGGNNTENVMLQQCIDGWCCGNDHECCNSGTTFSLRDPLVYISDSNSTSSAATTTAVVTETASSSSSKVAIGVGVGVPLAVLSVAMLGAGFWWGRRNMAAKYQALQSQNDVVGMLPPEPKRITGVEARQPPLELPGDHESMHNRS